MDQADKPAQFASSEQPRTGSQRTLNHQTHSWPLPARVLVCALLAAATFLTFFPVLSSGFVNLDDGEYVTDNPHVATGLRPENIVWAFTTGHASNWHPLTWLSHMVDVQLFGMRPGWHHGVNLLLHITNSVIVLLLLFRLTRAPWPSFITAGLFALHPLHVESVAWISERKDVLSTLFFLLTIWFYAKYTTARQGADTIGNDASASGQPNVLTRDWRRYYSLALLLFALGLMSKPMVVTLPFVLLLLDYWPLGRLAGDGVTKWLALLKEKLPFL
ncbi:MAG TPA: hypothetical protein VL793_06180, partial [Patescibacteria group bacterium]|nr:hypothetical protein [Patescibacteria group bacterium]